MEKRSFLIKISAVLLVLAFSFSLWGCDFLADFIEYETPEPAQTGDVFATYRDIEIPDYSGSANIELNGNKPFFTENEITDKSFELYGQLDELGRCTSCVSSIGQDLMPDTPRESISSVRPTGWMSVKYDFVDGESLYNRCHLIAFSLTGESANNKNLITGTRYMNTLGMLDCEEKTAAYIRDTGNHVMYRVTPVFKGDELIARGVVMEGLSVEDDGKGICFCVFCYNVQPGVVIDYMTGENREATYEESGFGDSEGDYVMNRNSMKFHLKDCPRAEEISEKNRQEVTCDRDLLVAQGYVPCSECKP